MKTLLLLSAICFLSVFSKAQNARDKEAVKKVIIDFQDDFNEGSFKKAKSYSTSDWRHINPGGGIDKGRDSVLLTVRAVHQSFLKGVSMQIESMEIRFLTPDVAIADVIHQFSPYTTPDGVKHEHEKQIKTYVLVKKQGKWLLAQDQHTIILQSGMVANQR